MESHSITTFIVVFVTGLIENFGLALNYRFLQRDKKMASFLTSFVNIVIWAFIIKVIIENIYSIPIILTYAVGFGFGDIFAIILDNYIEKLSKIKLTKLYKKWKQGKKRKR